MGYAYGTEFFIAWYSGNSIEYDIFIYRATGEWAVTYWIMVGCNVLVPLPLFIKKVRTNLGWLFLISILVNVGMWFERFVIIVTSLSHDHMPHNWGTIEWHWPDIFMLAGSFGWFFMWMLLFLRTMPWIAITESRELIPPPGKDGKGGGTL